MTQAKVIPIAGQKEDPEIFRRAFDLVSEELRDNELVCIFPEGSLTPDGEIHEFKSGIEHIIKRDPVPVVPMALKGLWGSFFSHKGGKAMNKVPRRFLFPVDLVIGKPIQPEVAKALHLESEVKKLASL